MSHELESFPEFDAFTSKDQGEAERYRRVRQAFLTHVLTLPAVSDLFARLNKRTGLGKLTAKLVSLDDQLAKALKLPDRTTLNQCAATIKVDALPAQVRRLAAKREAVVNKFAQCLSSLAQTCGPDVSRMVKGWGMSWPWIDRDLIHAFMLNHGAEAIGVSGFTRSLQIKPEPLTLNARFDYSSEADLEAALNHLRHRGQAALVQQDGRTKGRKPKTPQTTEEPDHLDRYVEWFVRHRIGGVSVSDLAEEFYGRSHYENAYSTVSKGIARAEKLLSLTTFIRQSSPPLRN